MASKIALSRVGGGGVSIAEIGIASLDFGPLPTAKRPSPCWSELNTSCSIPSTFSA